MNNELKRISARVKHLKGRVWLFWDPSTWASSERKALRDCFEWDGETRLMFVAENPSEGKVPILGRVFFKALEAEGLGGALVTDLIKVRSLRPGKEYWITEHARILDDEVNVVKPILIVAVGGRTERVLRSGDSTLDVPVERVIHYSQTSHEALRKSIARVARIYRAMIQQRAIEPKKR